MRISWSGTMLSLILNTLVMFFGLSMNNLIVVTMFGSFAIMCSTFLLYHTLYTSDEGDNN